MCWQRSLRVRLYCKYYTHKGFILEWIFKCHLSKSTKWNLQSMNGLYVDELTESFKSWSFLLIQQTKRFYSRMNFFSSRTVTTNVVFERLFCLMNWFIVSFQARFLRKAVIKNIKLKFLIFFMNCIVCTSCTASVCLSNWGLWEKL